MKNKTAYITHSICLKHDMGQEHFECPQRLIAIEERLKESGVYEKLVHFEAPLVSNQQLARVHSQNHLDFIEQSAPLDETQVVTLNADTNMSFHSLEAAKRAAGATVLATDLVISQQVDNAFCAVRPPGHHAKRDQAMGFCFYNNIMVGIYHALANGIERVALIDFDVHHGNGSENIIADNKNILFCSSFQHPNYPNEPCKDSENILCSPFPAGSGSQAFRDEVTQRWLPALEKFKPQLIFISAGFDAHQYDHLANMNLTEEDYYWITNKLASYSSIVSSLEGGYNTHALANSVNAHLLALVQKQL